MANDEPIIIYRSVDRDGQTFALKPNSEERLREQFKDTIRISPRVFIAHETNEDYERIHGSIVPQIITLLTGLSRERLETEFGSVEFRNPETEETFAA